MSVPLDTVLKLFRLGYWAIAIRARGEIIRRRNPHHEKDPNESEFIEEEATGKEPIGKAWGIARWPEERLPISIVGHVSGDSFPVGVGR